MREPKRVASVWTELPFMRGPEGARRLREWHRAHVEIQRQCAERRSRVLAIDWAAKRVARIFGLSRADHWTGFVPAARDPDDTLNNSAARRELMELLRDVERFEKEGLASGTDQVGQA